VGILPPPSGCSAAPGAVLSLSLCVAGLVAGFLVMVEK
jgi:hypothetical protein